MKNPLDREDNLLSAQKARQLTLFASHMERPRSRYSRYRTIQFAIVFVKQFLRIIHYHLYEWLCRFLIGGAIETLHLDAQSGYHSSVRHVLQATDIACAPYAYVS